MLAPTHQEIYLYNRLEEVKDERDALQIKIDKMEAEAVPPYTKCDMCGHAGCCEGEWSHGSELRCTNCGREGHIESFDHESGHTCWILWALYDEEDEEGS